jgi:hypothetical protein
VSDRQGRVSKKEQYGGDWFALKRADSGSISQEQCGWDLKGDDSGMVEFKKNKSLFLKEGSFLSTFQSLQERFP